LKYGAVARNPCVSWAFLFVLSLSECFLSSFVSDRDKNKPHIELADKNCKQFVMFFFVKWLNVLAEIFQSHSTGVFSTTITTLLITDFIIIIQVLYRIPRKSQ